MHERGVDAPLEQKGNVIAQKSKERAVCDLLFSVSRLPSFLSVCVSLCARAGECECVKRESQTKFFP